MRKSIVVLVLTALVLVFLALGYVQYRSGYIEIAIMGSFSSSRFISHRSIYYEALYLYREDHPHTRLKILEVDISYQATPDLVREKISRLRKKGIRVIIAPFSSALTDIVSLEAEKYGIVVFSPFSRYAHRRENLISMIPSLSDFARLAVGFAEKKGFKKVTILKTSSRILDEKMADKLKEFFLNAGMEVTLRENLRESDLDSSNLVVIAKSFPVFLSKDLAVLNSSAVKPTVLLVSMYLYPFEKLYGKYLNGVYAIDHSFYYTERGKGIVRSYEERFGRVPPPGVVAVYDALSLAEKILREKRDPDVSYVRGLRVYRGFMGDIPLDGGDMTDLLTLVIFKEIDGKLVKIQVRE